jgi:hypothetical protein
VRQTASLVFMRGDLTAASRVVATATGIWKIFVREAAGAHVGGVPFAASTSPAR